MPTPMLLQNKICVMSEPTVSNVIGTTKGIRPYNALEPTDGIRLVVGF